MTSAAISGVPRINLLPKSEVARRERDGLVRVWTWVLLGAIVLAVLIILAAFAYKLFADQRLAAEQTRSTQLVQEIASLSEVSTAVSTQQELTQFRGEAMATDLEWTPIVSKLLSALPGDATLTGFTFTVGGAPQGEDPATAVGVSGTFTVGSPTPLDIVATIRSLRSIEGVLFADGQSVSSSTEGSAFSYLLNVEFDQTAYSGAFAESDEEGE